MARNNIIKVVCSHCGARFKIRNPQSGAVFNCYRCKTPIAIPGEKVEEGSKNPLDIVKIELHRPNFFRSREEKDIFPESKTGITRILKKQERKAEDTFAAKEHLEKKIFASDIQNRRRLLYLISRFTYPSCKGKKGKWMRKLPLQVFMYEGVVSEVFDWDYAPGSILVAEGRMFVNISQEGESDLFSLLTGKYVHNLKLTTTQHLNITAYQITSKGQQYLEKIPESDRELVLSLIQCPKCKSILVVKKRKTAFFLKCTDRKCPYEKQSNISDAEDVSYFSVPYFPPSLTSFSYTAAPNTPKRLEAYFQNTPRDNIKDTLEELLYLSKVKVLIGEWLPFGSNQMAALNYKLGSNERVQSAKFTQEVDTSPEGTTIDIPESLTLVKVNDYKLASYVDFEAFCYLPEDPQIIQIEEFAVHLDFTGSIRYGLEILAVNERNQSKISLDHLPRVLVDILQDSTTIMDTLLTNYQKNLLRIIFQGKSWCRDKYFFVLAEEIHCFGEEKDSPSELMQILSQKKYQNEINQITEEIKETAIFCDGTVLIMGTHGCILVTKNPEKYENLISDFLFIMDLEIFLSNFFTRLFLMNDELNDIQKLIKNCEADPNAITIVQQMLSRTSGDAILMEELRGYLDEAISIFRKKLKKEYNSYPESMEEVIQTFQIHELAEGLKIRIQDIKKIIRGTQEYLRGLTRVTEVISERQMRRIQETLSHNTRSLEEITKTNERSGMSLRILEIILAGGLAFNIMDQFTGEWKLSDDALLRPFLQEIFDIPGIWLLFSIMLWALFASAIFLFMRWLEKVNSRAIGARIKLDLRCDINILKQYLSTKEIITHNADVLNISKYIKIRWEEAKSEKWLGNNPTIELVYDEKNGFLISALIEINRPTPKTTIWNMQNILLHELKEAKVLR